MSTDGLSTPFPGGRWIWGRNPRRTLVRAILLGLCAWVVFSGPLRPIRVVGESMEPTLRSGEFRWANLWGLRHRPPRPGEVVLVRADQRGRLMYLKRVLAVPGERLAFQDGRLVVNGREVPEPYVVYSDHWQTREYELQPDEFYVAGDNRDQPMGQHATFVAPRARIAGILWGQPVAGRGRP